MPCGSRRGLRGPEAGCPDASASRPREDLMGIAFAVIVVIVLLVVARSMRVANEWQRAVVLRLGRLHKVKGPGIYLVLPLIDNVASVVDLRIQTTGITAEQALTRDTVAVGVD